MKQENDKRLKWMKPGLESLGKSELTLGLCTTGTTPDPGDPACTNGAIAANSCSPVGGSVIILP